MSRKPPAHKPDTWAGAFKSLGMRALSTGKFWQFCFMCVLIAFAINIDSADWVKIADIFLSSRVYSGLGWTLWVATVTISVMFHKVQRTRYLEEIERLAQDRNDLQSKIAGPVFQSSKRIPEE